MWNNRPRIRKQSQNPTDMEQAFACESGYGHFKPPLVHSEGIRLRTGESGWQHFPRLLLPTSDTLGLMKTIFAGSSWRSQAGAGTILGALFLASSVPTMPRRRRTHAAERFFSSSLLPLLWSMKTRKAEGY